MLISQLSRNPTGQNLKREKGGRRSNQRVGKRGVLFEQRPKMVQRYSRWCPPDTRGELPGEKKYKQEKF